MDINFFKRGMLKSTFLIILLGFRCNKDGTKPCPNFQTAYSFVVTSEWSPQREIYYVGDTIFFTSTFPKILTDQINPSLAIDYSNSTGIGGDISIYYLDSITHQPVPAKDSFQFVSITGNFLERSINQNQGVNTNYFESSSSYQFKGAIICKRKGIYGFGVADLLSQGLRGKNCTNAGFNMTVTNTDKHLHLHQYALNINPNDAYLQQKGYDFRVQ
jgi:hypothetical protein